MRDRKISQFRRAFLLLGFFLATVMSGCTPFYHQARFAPVADFFVMDGTIDHSTLGALRRAMRASPSIKMIAMEYVPGSMDEKMNQITARLVHKQEFTTFVPSNGLIASGGVSFFLAGTQRIIQTGACIGVHSWFEYNSGLFGSNAHKDNSFHKTNLRYYRAIGIDEDFYWFTLKAATPNEMHWMTPQEIRDFDLAILEGPDEDFDPQACDVR